MLLKFHCVMEKIDMASAASDVLSASSGFRVVKLKAEAGSVLLRKRAQKYREVRRLLWKQKAVKEFHIQKIFREDPKALVSVGNDVDRILQHPEHFPRNPMTLAYSPSSSSPWDGSEYKTSLLVSLEMKLLLSISFVALKRGLDIRSMAALHIIIIL